MDVLLLIVILLTYLVLFAIALIIGTLDIIAIWLLFNKAGEKGWSAIIPVYNYFVLSKVATGNYTLGWVYLGITIANIVLSLFATISTISIGMMSDDAYKFIQIVQIVIYIAIIGLISVISGYTNYMFSKSFGKPNVWNVCMIFIAPILIIIMGFDKKTYYIGPKGIPKNSQIQPYN